MKKIISLLLSVCVLFSVFSFGAANAFADASEDGNYEYKVKADGSAKITAYTGSDFNVVIPESIDGHTVTAIGYGAFTATSKSTKIYSYNDCIRRITVPKTVTSISIDAFKSLPLLKRIDVDEDNPSYCSKDGVLFNKDKTTLICYPTSRMDSNYTIPKTVKKIDSLAFYGSVFLQGVKIGKNVKTIEYGAFLDCLGIEAIYVPETVKKIGNYALGMKSAYYSSFKDEFFDEEADPEDREWASSYEFFEGYFTLNSALTVYGKKGSAAEKYCKKITNENEEVFSVNFDALDKPKLKVKNNKWTSNRYNGLDYYYLNVRIYKGKKLVKKAKLYITSDTFKSGRSLKKDFGLKKGAYSMKIRGKLNFAGRTVKTGWSKKVKFTVK